ncbi:TPA: GGDEF domain-containing protein [Escherichia coli]|nr:GGDEF domain-containing protein [Escherichia coli]
MHVQPISTFRLFQEGHLLRNSIAIFVLTTLFYFIGAELRLVHELSLFWPLNGVMAGVFARYVWLNRLHLTCLLTFVTGAVEVVLVANSVIDISVGSPFSIPQMFSARLGIATMAICPIMVSFSVAAINSLMKQVALRADFDFLTQVYSRSGLYEALKSPSLKQTQHLTVMLLDIDYFKSINDNYGHECGDKVLSVFAQHIQKIVGDKGLVARMGGEEFAVAVPSVNPVDGLLMAEKIRKGVELQPFTWQQKTLYLTVSIGVGSGCASYRTLTDDFNKLMVEADTCLYRSKKDGRNRTSTMRYGEEVV